MSLTVDTQELEVGMFIHLDVGWMSHPFPLSSFRIATPQQIATIRELGLQRVRWVPAKSDAGVRAMVSATAAAAFGDAASTGGAAAPRQPAPLVPETPAQTAARERRELLARQRETAQICETQYAEAGRAWSDAYGRVITQPEQARHETEALTQALLDKMLVEGEMCIRVLNTAAGDRVAAHAMNVAVVSLLMGRTFSLDESSMSDLGVGALLHDVGKLDLPERIRHADDRFNLADVQAWREHVSLGVAHGRRMGLSDGALQVIAHHHELADGTGFPERIGADRMPAASRVVSLVNRFDNLCNPAVLSRALTPHEALSTMFAQTRSKFDATMLNAFIRMMGVYPAGSVVQLTDDRYALVVTVNSTRPLKPRVLVHDPAVPRDEALHLDLETTPGLGIRRSIRAAQLPPTALDYLSPRQRVDWFFEAASIVPRLPGSEDDE
jgi:putative nucleotidyltransferase with HDIG domain